MQTNGYPRALHELEQQFARLAPDIPEYVDLDSHPEAEARLTWMTGGRVHSPIVSVGGQLLVQPSIAELQWILSRS